MTAVRPGAIFNHINLASVMFVIVRPLLYITATIMLFRPDAETWFSDYWRASSTLGVSANELTENQDEWRKLRR
ncbi:hypothetical protein FHR23_000293 [Stakelama sediminis]|uniref:Uncharacterized protein n=2 Tax=Stakelama sediminis TaxID=463200 RepID=A0A840YUY3_9SPHN|nr:hypothetical protein [Stakelama sediminis]